MMRKHEVVFVDMDGVLCDFVSASLRAHASDFSHDDISHWDIDQKLGITPAEFWDKIHAIPTFWNTLEPYLWKDVLLSIGNLIGQQVKVLTSPAKSASCYAGKYEWCIRHLPPKIEFIPCKSKHLLAGPNRVLIDDSDSNIEAWRSAGGLGVLFPQPWNVLRDQRREPIESVLEQLKCL